MASFRWLLQLHRDVPKAARFYSEGLNFTVNVCTLRWAELQSDSLKLALMQSSGDSASPNGSPPCDASMDICWAFMNLCDASMLDTGQSLNASEGILQVKIVCDEGF